MDITVIDYGIGNIKSIYNAFNILGIKVKISKDRDVILKSDGLILPGVGAFKTGMDNLLKFNLDKTIYEFIDSNKPILGICLGMQLFFDSSNEFGKTKGLGVIKGKVKKLEIEKKLPHVSWNSINKNITKWDKTILDNIQQNEDFYFVHSYVVYPENKDEILSTTSYYSQKFCSVVKKNKIYGTQFHPEKSGEKGLKILKNFIRIV